MPSVDRRVVTVLFADLADFTGLSERLDPEDVARVQEAYFSLAEQAVAAEGGLVEKFIGDAVMATFGTTRAADDDALRAVRAGRGLVEAVDRLGQELGMAGALSVRVGVDTGVVVVTRLGAGWRVTGDTVNTAARLQAGAEPGQVLVGPHTALAVEDDVELVPAGERHLKGKAAPVPTWLAGADRQGAHRQDGRRLGSHRHGLRRHGLTAPLLGREDEMARLLDLLEPAGGDPAGDARAALVLAPPGTGKTRLVTELAERLQAQGRPCWTVRVGLAPGRGYDVVADLLLAAWTASRATGGADHPDDAARVADAFTAALTEEDPAHARRVAELVRAVVDGDPLDATPAELYEAWTSALDAAAPHAVWVVEDLHLAGADLKAFLHHALEHPAVGSRRRVVLTARPGPLGADALAGSPHVAVLALEPLAAQAARELVVAYLGPGVLPEGLLDAVVVASGGNPLFVEELVRSWIQTGLLRRTDPGGWRFTGDAAGAPALPTTVQAIYQGQLDALPDPVRAVVEHGSVPGTTFPVGALPALGVADATRPLDELTRVGLLVGPHEHAVGAASYTYRHALLRDTAYGSIGRHRRAELHVRFARWIQGLPTALGTELAGTHLALAHDVLPATSAGLDDGTTAVDLARDAAALLASAAAASMVSAPQRAASLLAHALALPAGTGAERLTRRLDLAEALRRSGDLALALEAFGAGAEQALARDDDAGLVTAAVGYEETIFASRLPRDDRSVQLLRAAERLVPADDAVGRSQVLSLLGRALHFTGDTRGAQEACRRAVELVDRLPHRSAADGGTAGLPHAPLARALLALRITQDAPDQLAERLRDGRRAFEAVGGADAPDVGPEDLELRLDVARLHLLDLIESGDLAGADAVLAVATGTVELLARPLHRWYPPMWRGMRALLDARFAEAAALAETFRTEAHRARYASAELVWTVQRLQLALDTGGLEDLLPVLATRRAEAPVRWAFGPALALARLGRRAEAQVHLDVHDEQLSQVPHDLSRSAVLSYLAQAAFLLDDAAAAARLRDALEPWDGHRVVLGAGAVCLGSATAPLALCHLATGDVAAATALLTRAVAEDDALPAPAAAVWSRTWLATALQRAGRDEEARGVVVRAQADAARLGMAEALRVLGAAEAAHGVASDGADEGLGNLVEEVG
ncbi:adenylate/guanylate cyclase domain-containing protein [Actinotalea sp. Marseille-Q4924]|uniref:adenylate/guanylate cyclase domain-containing protein n=1 Tax=Actinotalea sp. Marseille-Q4924 TaxID=2866571 RepID=UPI001CE469E9|nr:adenylate/guanylate cyclase domain-containing protein [Actinotalea sp. Marseille-Q4924]